MKPDLEVTASLQFCIWKSKLNFYSDLCNMPVIQNQVLKYWFQLITISQVQELLSAVQEEL